VLTIDSAGRACLWAEACGTLLRAAQLTAQGSPLRPSSRHALMLPGGHHAALPCLLPLRSSDAGGAISRAVERHGVAVVDLRTLEVADVTPPASLLSLQKFWQEGQQNWAAAARSACERGACRCTSARLHAQIACLHDLRITTSPGSVLGSCYGWDRAIAGLADSYHDICGMLTQRGLGQRNQQRRSCWRQSSWSRQTAKQSLSV